LYDCNEIIAITTEPLLTAPIAALFLCAAKRHASAHQEMSK
jgi:hypothetical protein